MCGSNYTWISFINTIVLHHLRLVESVNVGSHLLKDDCIWEYAWGLFANTMPFFIRDLSIYGYRYRKGSWSQSPADTGRQLYFSPRIRVRLRMKAFRSPSHVFKNMWSWSKAEFEKNIEGSVGIYSFCWKNNSEGKKHTSKLPVHWRRPVTPFSFEKDKFLFLFH